MVQLNHRKKEKGRREGQRDMTGEGHDSLSVTVKREEQSTSQAIWQSPELGTVLISQLVRKW